MSVMCLVCVLFHGSLYPLFPFYEMFFLSCNYKMNVIPSPRESMPQALHCHRDTELRELMYIWKSGSEPN